MDHARKLKFSYYVHLPSINKKVSILLHLIDSVKCRRGYYIQAWVQYFSCGTIYDVISSSYVLLSYINAIYKFGHAWVSL